MAAYCCMEDLSHLWADCLYTRLSSVTNVGNIYLFTNKYALTNSLQVQMMNTKCTLAWNS